MTTTMPEVTQPERTDFYNMLDLLEPADRELVDRVREFMTTEVAPIINSMWTREQFPHHLIPRFGELGIAGLPYQGYGCPGRGYVVDGAVMMELASIDSSMATFHGVHSGLAMGSIYACGSEEQKSRWLPAMARCEQIGAFALTEPDVGSGAARGLTTTARRDGDTWVLNGEKKWIGNATFADLNVVWAVDEADKQVKGFVVEGGTPGFEAVKISDKIALRVVQNAHITLSDCRVPEANRLQAASSFADTAQVLRRTRLGVAWEAVGCAKGAYDIALAYAKERHQFGRPIAGFQLVAHGAARLATLAEAATWSARLACWSTDPSDTAAAKGWISAVSAEVAALGHQLHGAIGFTEEYGLQRLTKRLRTLRFAWGDDAHHLAALGRLRAAEVSGFSRPG